MVYQTPISESFTAVANGTAVVLAGDYHFSISGTFVATIDFQRSFDDGTSWQTIKSFTAAEETDLIAKEHGVMHRAICSAFTSGTAVVKVYK